MIFELFVNTFLFLVSIALILAIFVLLIMLYAVIMDAKATRKSFYIFLVLYAVTVSIIGYKVFSSKDNNTADNNSDKIKITVTGYATEEEFNNIKNNHVLENISEYIDDINIDMER